MASPTTTHRHDYRWPASDCIVPKAEAPSDKCDVQPERCENGQGDKPWCGLVPQTSIRPPVGEVCADRDLSCRARGPLVPLLNPAVLTAPIEPRLQPPGCLQQQASAPAHPWCDANARGDVADKLPAARLASARLQDSSRPEQLNQYLQKLCDKYPNPTGVVTATPRDELMRRVYADRYRTTYQTDFCKNADDAARQLADCSSHDVNNKYMSPSMPQVTADCNNENKQYVQCKCGCGCRVKVGVENAELSSPRVRPIACRPAAVSHNVHFSCCTPKKKPNQMREEVGPPEKIPPWASEYTESIGRTGQLIMDQQLLHPKKKNY